MKKVLNSKIYVEGGARERALDSARGVIDHELEGLELDYEVRLREDNRLEVEGVGEDLEAGFNHLTEIFGEMETDPKRGEKYIGSLESWDEDGFVIDIGREVLVPQTSLEELGKGSPEQIRERFGLVQHMPLEIVWGSDEDNGSTSPHLSGEQVDGLWEWRKNDDTGGRLNVNSVTRSEVRATINRAGHAHDIVTVERLGFLEQSVVCKRETDPPGLLSSIGQYVKGEMMCVV